MMKLAIIGFDESRKKQMVDALEDLIQKSQCYLFVVVTSGPGTLADRWAKHNGAPVEYLADGSLETLLSSATYFLIWNDGSTAMHRLIFKVRAAGLHGTLLGEKYGA